MCSNRPRLITELFTLFIVIQKYFLIFSGFYKSYLKGKFKFDLYLKDIKLLS